MAALLEAVLINKICFGTRKRKHVNTWSADLALNVESAKRIYLEVADEMLFALSCKWAAFKDASKYFNQGLGSMYEQLPNYCSIFLCKSTTFFQLLELSIDT